MRSFSSVPTPGRRIRRSPYLEECLANRQAPGEPLPQAGPRRQRPSARPGSKHSPHRLSGHRGHLHLLLNLLRLPLHLGNHLLLPPQSESGVRALLAALKRLRLFFCASRAFSSSACHYAGVKHKQIESTKTSRLPKNSRIPFRAASPPSWPCSPASSTAANNDTESISSCFIWNWAPSLR